ncbi:Aste57867_2406 [Aphanomyces stellatus]|uniref:Aste57867_2406 protein n=1 Tax=Aphanomyces stellatus TaxID=120398 RepID=A0A485K7K9_9STRA|nr:hypothetical protein As57867_002400 [Aphanomyces stellatus]VFT79607.1 Aste57867_2406 [Aphanomyces stellatus]
MRVVFALSAAALVATGVRADAPLGFEDLVKNATAAVNEEYGLNLTEVAEMPENFNEAEDFDYDRIPSDEEVESIMAAKPDVHVKATANGGLSFKILQIPDIHYTGFKYFPCFNPPAEKKWFCFEKYMTEMMSKMLDDVKPDFVVFTGDQIEALGWPHGLAATGAIDAYSNEVRRRSIPWATIYGNHDESYLPGIMANKRDMMNYIQSLPFAYSQPGPTNIGGLGNYELSIKAPTKGFWGDAEKDVFRMYFMDTGKSGTVTPAQNQHLKSLAASHNGQKVPALMFFHIPIPEYQEFAGVGQGEKGEKISSKAQSGLFQNMVEMGDVVASFCGHDHMNDFCFQKKDTKINLCYGGAVGYGAAYGKAGHARRTRVIEWNLTPKKETITTWQYIHSQDNSNRPKFMLFEKNL